MSNTFSKRKKWVHYIKTYFRGRDANGNKLARQAKNTP